MDRYITAAAARVPPKFPPRFSPVLYIEANKLGGSCRCTSVPIVFFGTIMFSKKGRFVNVSTLSSYTGHSCPDPETSMHTGSPENFSFILVPKYDEEV
jgi:hypothetical protein